jgi:hypothetical protein
MRALTFLTCLSLIACSAGSYNPGPGGGGPVGPSDGTSGGIGNTFDHDNTGVDPWDLLQRLQQEGPPEISTRMHSCQKLTYRNLGRLLASRGVDLNATGANGIPSAGELYRGGSQALGAPNYDARVPEAVEPTAAGATKLMDIFVQAAPEIMANLGSTTACPGAQLFDAQGRCDADGLTCLLGYPATDQHLALCNQAVAQASTPQIGQTIAIAALLSAAHTCE